MRIMQEEIDVIKKAIFNYFFCVWQMSAKISKTKTAKVFNS